MDPLCEAITGGMDAIVSFTARWQIKFTQLVAMFREISSQHQLAGDQDSAGFNMRQITNLENEIRKVECRAKLQTRKAWKELLCAVVEPYLFTEHAKTIIEHGADFRFIRFSRAATLLHKVVESRDFDAEFLKFLLDRGAFVGAVNSEGQTALGLNLHLNYFHHCEATVALLEKTSQRKINEMDCCGRTYLMKATEMGCSRCVEAFLRREADVNMASTYQTLPVVLCLMNGESGSAAVETFRLLLRKTDKQKLLRLLYVYRRDNPDSEFEPLGLQVKQSCFEYIDVIWEEGYQLLDFYCSDPLKDTDGLTKLFNDVGVAIALDELPEPYLTEIIEVFLHEGVMSDPRIYGKLTTGNITAKFFLIFVHRGLNAPANLFDLSEPFGERNWQADIADVIDTLQFLASLGVASNHFLRDARHEIEQAEAEGRCSLNENLRSKCSLLGTESRSLKRICSIAIREHLFQCHGQVRLVPLVLQLEVPEAVGDIILCRDVQIEEY